MRHLLILTAVAGVLCVATSPAQAQSTPPSMLAFHGKLAAEDGPVDGTINVQFELFDSASGGTSVWTEAHDALEIKAGAFSAVLGQSTPITTSLVTASRLYLEITVNGETLSPRMAIVSVPYALKADDANTVGGLGPADLQRRVAMTCDPGSSIRAINEDGSVTCETDDVGDTGGIGQISAGFGLTGGGSGANVSVAVDPATVQRRVDGTCAAGSSIRAISSTGAVTCEPDDAGQQVAAGTGINVSAVGGTATVSADTTYLQRRVTGTCASGAINGINANGTVSCASTDVDPTTFNGSTPVANGYNATGVNATSTTFVTLTSVTITAPRSGYVMLSGSTMAICANCLDNGMYGNGFIGWDDNQSGTPTTLAGYFSKWIPSGGGPSAVNPTTFHRFAVSPGTHTFYLRANSLVSNRTISHSYINATAIFIPN